MLYAVAEAEREGENAGHRSPTARLHSSGGGGDDAGSGGQAGGTSRATAKGRPPKCYSANVNNKSRVLPALCLTRVG